MATQIRAELRLLGRDFNHEAITAALGLNPTATWRAGDLINRTRLRRDSDGWVLAAATRDQLDLATSLEELLNVIEPLAPQIDRLRSASGLEVVISCAVYIEDAAPSAYLPHRLIKAIDKLGASLDVDLILTAPR